MRLAVPLTAAEVHRGAVEQRASLARLRIEEVLARAPSVEQLELYLELVQGAESARAGGESIETGVARAVTLWRRWTGVRR